MKKRKNIKNILNLCKECCIFLNLSDKNSIIYRITQKTIKEFKEFIKNIFKKFKFFQTPRTIPGRNRVFKNHFRIRSYQKNHHIKNITGKDNKT